VPAKEAAVTLRPVRVRRISYAAKLCAVIGVASVTLIGCGGGDAEKTFAGEGYAFLYPGEWRELDSKGGFQQGRLLSTVTLGPGKGSNNALIVSVYRVADFVTEQNVQQMSDVAAHDVETSKTFSDVRIVAGPTVGRIRGLPGFVFEISFTARGQPLHNQMAFLFEGMTEYFFNCQWTQEGADEMKQDCQQALHSFHLE